MNETVSANQINTMEPSEGVYYLPTNYMLQDRYRIDSVLGSGGFGITYSCWDTTLKTKVAIKEYYPSGLVARNSKTSQVVPMASEKYVIEFRAGIDRVIDEARRMARFRNTPGFVGVYDFFEANNTAYIVMEFIDGLTLDAYCKAQKVDNTSLIKMLVPIMDALQVLHSEGIIHRDISPDNIMVDYNGNLKLLDFGAARGFVEGQSNAMSVILKKSYAPEEQYRTKGKQGPWTDVYALGATIYELITGQTPPSSIDRLLDDEIIDIRQLALSLTNAQADAIMTALSVKYDQRWKSMEDFKNALLGLTANRPIPPVRQSENISAEHGNLQTQPSVAATNTSQSDSKKSKKGIAITVIAFVIAISITGFVSALFYLKNSDSSSSYKAEATYEEEEAEKPKNKKEKTQVDSTNWKNKVEDKAQIMSADKRELLESKISSIEEKYMVDIAFITLNENLTDYAKLDINYDGVVSNQVKIYADNYSEANGMGIGNNMDAIVFVDNWNREADGQAYSWFSTTGRIVSLFSDSDYDYMLSPLKEITSDDADPYEQYSAILDRIAELLEANS